MYFISKSPNPTNKVPINHLSKCKMAPNIEGNESICSNEDVKIDLLVGDEHALDWLCHTQRP